MLKICVVALAAIAVCCPIFAANVGVTVGPGFVFTPSTVTVNPGDTVVWTFAQAFHTTTSDSTIGPEVWDSGIVTTVGATFSHTFTASGTYPYYCSIHSVPGGTRMNGTVVVSAPPPAPLIEMIFPSSGPTTGGTAATVTGANFDSSCGVTFGGSAATVGTITAFTIDVTTPAHAAGPVDVMVTCTSGSATLTNGFTFVAVLPSITSVTPASGPTTGGTAATINGSNFDSSCGVTFGGSAATVGTFTSSTIDVTTPPHAAGPVNVAVACTSGSATLTNGFTFLAGAPSITSVTPSSGPTTGGTNATINGSNFDSSCNVTFGGVGVTPSAVSSTSISVATPPHAAGPVTVSVACTGGNASLANAFTYLAPAPVITSVVPSSSFPGASVTIVGLNFVNGAVARFAGTLSSSTTFADANTLIAVVPALPAGPARVTVTNPDGQVAIYDGFTVLGETAAIPLFSASALLLLACALVAIAAMKLR